MGGTFSHTFGGKGGNQAVAARVLGADVTFISRVGEDKFGSDVLEHFTNLGINTTHVRKTHETPTGVALVLVDKDGNNAISVASGANLHLTPEDVLEAEDEFKTSRVVLAQLEIPLEAVERALSLAKKYGNFFILDPAPSRSLSRSLLSEIDAITPNQIEAEILSGISITDLKSAHLAADYFLYEGVQNVFITLGGKGIFFKNSEITKYIPPCEVNVVDTTAAGDAFAGGLAHAISHGKSVLEAANFGSYVASLSVTRLGGQSSLPSSDEVEAFIKEEMREKVLRPEVIFSPLDKGSD